MYSRALDKAYIRLSNIFESKCNPHYYFITVILLAYPICLNGMPICLLSVCRPPVISCRIVYAGTFGFGNTKCIGAIMEGTFTGTAQICGYTHRSDSKGNITTFQIYKSRSSELETIQIANPQQRVCGSWAVSGGPRIRAHKSSIYRADDRRSHIAI